MRSTKEPHDFARMHGHDREIEDHLQNLCKTLVRTRGCRGTFEGAIVAHLDGTPYFECHACLKFGRSTLTEISVGGTTLDSAWRNAKLFAMRKALFNNLDVPVLGRLLENAYLTIDLDFFRNEPDASLGQDLYHVIIRINRRKLPWLSDSALSQSTYLLEASLAPLAEGKRTRYLVLRKVPPELRDVLAPLMKSDGEIFLHRLVMALDGVPLMGEPGKGTPHHVHHVNGVGGDCRRSNLQALTLRDHQALHSVWWEKYDQPSSEIRKHGRSILWPAPCLLLPYGMKEHDMNDMVANPETMLASEALARSGALVLPHQEMRFLPPMAIAEIISITGRKDWAVRLEKVLLALKECGGHGFIRDIKHTSSAVGLNSNTLNRALFDLQQAGVILISKIGNGFSAHYRLSREILF